MKLALVSDIHLSHTFDHETVPYGGFERLGREDVLIVAGDVDDGITGINTHLQALHKVTRATIVAVMGNHDYFYHSLTPDTLKLARMNLPGRVHLLENQTLELNGLRILGCTLWTDADRGRLACNALAMPDYSSITDEFGDLLEVQRMLAVNQASKDWLAAELAKPFAGKTVVLTHHAPSFQSQHPRYDGSPLSCYFCCDMEYLIEQHQPAFWLHGHLHEPVDYVIGATRIVCNPRGYMGERPPFYAPQIIDIQE